jgi:haloalkane dehalogenase
MNQSKTQTNFSIILVYLCILILYFIFSGIRVNAQYPISTQIQTGPSNKGLYRTVTPFEHADAQRTHVHHADFAGSMSDPSLNVVSNRLFEGTFPSPYNIVTREADEMYLFGGTNGEDDASTGPYVVKFDTSDGTVVWHVSLRNMRELGEFMWPGVITAHGNGFLYVVAGTNLWKLDTETGGILDYTVLPVPVGANSNDIVFNGFTVLEDGTIVAKSFGRPPGCNAQGTNVITECADNVNEQPPSMVVAIDPENLTILDTYQLSEASGGRITSVVFNGTQYVYVPGVENIVRFVWSQNQLILDPAWEVSDYVQPGQTPASAPVIMGDWLVFQTNYSISSAPLSVFAVSQADSSNRLSIDPLGIGFSGRSVIPSALSVDPDNMRMFSMDGGAGKIAAIDLINNNELRVRWVVDQMTLSHTSLAGSPEQRVLVSTSMVDVQPSQDGNLNYNELIIWRSADTGIELARSEKLGPMMPGVPIAPGFYGVWYYLGLDGTVKELKPVSEIPEQIGFEIQQFVSPTEIITWTSADITLEEYEALELPQGWMTTPPKEFDPDEGGHTRSPGAANDGDYTYGNFFGFDWLHNATVIEFGISMDSEGLLSGAYVSKHQEVTYYAGKVLHVIVSPEGDYYIRLIRDAFRSAEEPSLPVDWQKIEYVLPEDLTVRFPNPTLAIFADNGDSFQGPFSAELLGLDEDDQTPEILMTEGGVEFVRTPASRFENLPDWPYAYQYVEIDGLRQAYAEAGPADGPVVLLLHGQPSWSYLYRKMMSVLVEAGYRVIAMDHLGCGRSDKPIDIDYYTYLGHCDRLEEFIQILGLRDINLFGQDWGSLIGLRIAGMNPEWFASITIGNGDLIRDPAGVQLFPEVENPDEILDIDSIYGFIPDQQIPFFDGCELLFPFERGYDTFHPWAEFAMKSSNFIASEMLEALTWIPLTEEEEAAYDAPFPTRTHMAGIRKFPSLINEIPGTTEEAWAGLSSYEKPFLTLWGGNDPSTLGSCEMAEYLIENVPGSAGQPHDRLPQASHFLQEDEGGLIATRLVEFYTANSIDANPVFKDLGFELFQANSPNEIIVWFSDQITEEEFNAIELPAGWFKSQTREGTTTSDRFLRSPGADEEGPLTEAELFGHTWEQNAILIETGIEMDDQGLLEAASVAKYHELTYKAGKTVHILISPEGEYYILVGRDANRTQEAPTIPDSWQLVENVLVEDLIVQLPNPTLNIRADNEDSFQGPLSAELLGLGEVDDTPEILMTESGVEFVRTPASRFENLPDWPYAYQYVEIDGLRQAYAEEGPADGPVVLLLHGQPSWSYLYRKMIPVLAEAGYRVIAMDHLGMGRSDKPIDIIDYSYLGHAERLERFIEALDLSDINLFVQDWGSLIGLRVAGLDPEWFATISVGNGDLFVIPEGFEPFPPVENPNEVLNLPYPFAFFPDQQIPLYDGCDLIFDGGGQQEGFGNWIEYSMKGASFQPSQVVESLTWFPLPADVEAAYDAPFPTRDYMAGVRVFPSLINQIPGVNDAAWAGLTSYEKPFLTIWGSNDVGTLGSCETQQKLIDNVPGAAGQPHDRLPEAGHFLQSDQGEEIAMRLVNFYQTNGITAPENMIGFEILEIKSANEIIVWVNKEMTEEEFNSIKLPGGWFKNQTRESDATASRFLRSPDASVDGPLKEAELFGYTWRQNAKVIETGITVDGQGLLEATRVAKYHELTYAAGKPVYILISPENEYYIRVGRDANRTLEDPTIPENWQLIESVPSEDLVIQLPNPTFNIRADNVDSFQGPFSAELLGLDKDDQTPEILMTEGGVEFVRTPASRFEDLPNWPYAYQYIEIDGLRQAYAEAGPADGPVVLLLHGQPSWSYLYRKMMPVLAEAGYRVIAMDHIGCGRSDKPIDIDYYTYLGHNERLEKFIQGLGLQDINLFVQDWGSLIGLRVAGMNPEWFASIAVGNGALPIYPAGEEVFPPVENPNQIIDLAPFYAAIPDQQVPFYDGCERLSGELDNSYFGNWMVFSMKSSQFVPSKLIEAQTWFPISEEVEAAYDAPFPSRIYMAGIRKFPSLVNEVPGTTLQAWAGLSAYEKPFITIWAANDPGQMGGCEAAQVFIDNVPGAAGKPHARIPEASHFLQDDQGQEIAMRLIEFYDKYVKSKPKVGFEIHQIVSPNEIITWLSTEITEEEFEAIELPAGWFKNQPREGLADDGDFSRSPDALFDGELSEEEHFGYTWKHVATIIETGIELDNAGLLTANLIAKYHTIIFDANRTLSILVSPEGEQYVLVSRDGGRSTDEFSIPDSWQLVDYETSDELIIQLPNPTVNIRTENEDSYQGPIQSLSDATGIDRYLLY